jgi:hypothetical protein
MYKHHSCVAVKIKLTASSGNAGTCEELHGRSRIRTRQKAGVCVQAPSRYGVTERGNVTSVYAPLGVLQPRWDDTVTLYISIVPLEGAPHKPNSSSVRYIISGDIHPSLFFFRTSFI